MTPMENTNIILIGPGGAGKSTIGKLLAEKLDLIWLELDDVRWAYYDELGYDKDKAAQIRREQGFVAVVAYWEQFTIHSLERVLQEYPAGYVISTGAGNAVYDDPEFSARAKKALEPYPFVVLLLPAVDVEESVRICNARIMALEPEMQDLPGGPLAVNAGFNRNRRGDFQALATITIYNGEQTPQETGSAVIGAIEKR